MSRRGGDGLSRRQRAKQARGRLVTDGGGKVRVSILTGVTNTGDGIDLSHDVRLVRAALLYADEVELISPAAAMLAGILVATSQGGDFLLDLLDQVDDGTLSHLGDGKDPAQTRAEIQQLRAISALPRAVRRKRLGADGSRQFADFSRQIREKLGESASEMGAAMQGMWERAGAPDLEAAAVAGLLTISGDAFDFRLPGSEAVDKFAGTIQRLMEDPSNHLMFDEQMGGLARSLLAERPELHSGVAPHSKRATLGAGLVTQLPAFPDAPMTTILAARSELSAPLGRYRRAVGQLSERLAAGPVDTPELATEIEDLWRDEVHPTLRQLSDDLSGSAIVPKLLGQFPSDPKAWGGLASFGVSFLHVGVGALSELTQPAALATGASLVAASLGKAAQATMQSRRHAKSHELYYLLALNDRLA